MIVAQTEARYRIFVALLFLASLKALEAAGVVDENHDFGLLGGGEGDAEQKGESMCRDDGTGKATKVGFCGRKAEGAIRRGGAWGQHGI